MNNMKLDNFRISLSLGTQISNISLNNETGGLTVFYKDGDYCDGGSYSSQIDYICDASLDFGKPIL